MLRDKDRDGFDKRTREAMARMELAILKIAAGAIADALRMGPGSETAGSFGFRTELRKETRASMRGVDEAVARDMGDVFAKSAQEDVKDAKRAGAPASAREGANRRARAYAAKASQYTQGEMRRLAEGMENSAHAEYLTAISKARRRWNEVGERAIEEAVEELARKGITASTYTRSDGTVVHVPVDVGVRRATRAGYNNEMMLRNTVETAAETSGLVAIGATANCRESHEPMQNRIFKLYQDDKRNYPLFGDVEGLLDDFNCGHRFRVKAYYENVDYPYRDAEGRPFPFDDPLAGTGYDLEEARAAKTRQREMERGIRATKRVIEVKDSQGLDTAGDRAKLRAQQARLRDHVADNARILKRESWRENAYGTARTKAGAYGTAHLTNAQIATINPGAPGLSRSAAIAWPEPPRMLTAGEVAALRSRADACGVELHRLTDNARVSPAALGRMIDAAGQMLQDHPELAPPNGKPLTILVDRHMLPADFAMTDPAKKPHIIHINEAALRSDDALCEEYGKLAEVGHFVKGTGPEAIIYHETGHVYEKNNPVKALDLLKEYAQTDDVKTLEAVLINEVSRYATGGKKFGDEIASEVFSKWLSGLGNETTDAIIAGMGLTP